MSYERPPSLNQQMRKLLSKQQPVKSGWLRRLWQIIVDILKGN
jgi:hypothetical protein